MSEPPAPFERTVIAGERPHLLSWTELNRYRDLLYFVTRRRVLSRYKQTALGVTWAIVQPLVTMIVFSVFLGHLVGVPSDGVPYPVFAYVGILTWQLFSGTIHTVAGSMVGESHLLTSVYFPRVLLPISALLAALVDFGLAFLVLPVLMIRYGVAPGLQALLLLPLLALTGVIATGIGMGLAAVNVRYRDVGHAIPFLLQAWMFATPVVYPMSVVPEGWRLVYALNPMAGLVQGIRDAVLGHPLDLGVIAVSAASGLLLAALGVRLFRRMERTFADLV